MDQDFELPIDYKGKEWLLPARLIRFGYTYRLEVDINGTTVSFEKDEERNWTALVNPETSNANADVGIINAIIHRLSICKQF